MIRQRQTPHVPPTQQHGNKDNDCCEESHADKGKLIEQQPEDDERNDPHLEPSPGVVDFYANPAQLSSQIHDGYSPALPLTAGRMPVDHHDIPKRFV